MKSDCFYPFGPGSLQEFYLAFQMFCKEQGLWDGKARFEDAVISNGRVPDDPTFRRLAALAQNVINNPTAPAVVTGNDAAVMKMYFDSVLIKCARDFLRDRFGKHVENNDSSDLGG